MNLNTEAEKKNTYDAIVVGTGISGGFAAKELTGKGLKTLVLERGRDVKHPDYPTATKEPWELANADRPTQEDLQKQGDQFKFPGYTIYMLANDKDRDASDPLAALVNETIARQGPLDPKPVATTFAVWREGE